MNRLAAPHINALEPLLQRLLRQKPHAISGLPKNAHGPGVYLLSEGRTHLYVGRAKEVRSRLQQHQRESSKHNAATLAVLLAREATGNVKATYRPSGSRAALERDPKFAREFSRAKKRIRAMAVRVVLVPNPNTQALLEIYAAVATSARYNSFETS